MSSPRTGGGPKGAGSWVGHPEPGEGFYQRSKLAAHKSPSGSRWREEAGEKAMIRPILKYGAPKLEQRSEEVHSFDDELRELARDMLETMYAAPGIGLAAPQVGINRRLLVIDISGGQEPGHQIVLANPLLLEEEGLQKEEEGCLSIPGFTAPVERPRKVRVAGQDLQGAPVEITGEDLLARALCHEIDHLDGILYLDRISPLKRDLIKRKIRKLMKAGEW